jgi:hypothetical protein
MVGGGQDGGGLLLGLTGLVPHLDWADPWGGRTTVLDFRPQGAPVHWPGRDAPLELGFQPGRPVGSLGSSVGFCTQTLFPVARSLTRPLTCRRQWLEAGRNRGSRGPARSRPRLQLEDEDEDVDEDEDEDKDEDGDEDVGMGFDGEGLSAKGETLGLPPENFSAGGAVPALRGGKGLDGKGAVVWPVDLWDCGCEDRMGGGGQNDRC